jgi:hypothetical protein
MTLLDYNLVKFPLPADFHGNGIIKFFPHEWYNEYSFRISSILVMIICCLFMLPVLALALV